MFADTHAHLTSEELCADIEQILERAGAQGVDKIVNICTDEKTLEVGLQWAQRTAVVYNAAATTPHDVDEEGASFFPIVERAARDQKLVALGETGLDYHYEHSSRKTQQMFLEKYCALAVEFNLPLIFHCRDAFLDLFALTDSYCRGHPAVLHCFTGTKEEAGKVLDRGWYLSISGIVTFKKSESLREVVAFVPLDRLFLETDSPYLAPQSKRGCRNEPAYIVETAEVVAGIKKLSLSEVAEVTTANAERFFSFSKVKPKMKL